MKVLILLGLLVLSGAATAQGWTDELFVDGVLTEGTSDMIIISVKGVLPENDNKRYTTDCSANGEWIFKDTSSAGDRKNRAYSTAMAAFMSGSKIKLWYTDECDAWSYHQATAIKLTK